jgi:hypothetical protein
LGYRDAFKFAPFMAGGSKASVTQAWQFVAAHGAARPVKVAIIDGGFWLDTSGAPLSVPGSGGSDLPASPLQYDFPGDDWIADGENPASCTGGSACPWHGNRSAGVATGKLANFAAAAGTGGSVATPMLFKVDLSDGQVKRAMRAATARGADITNLSFGGQCNAWCRLGRSLTGYKTPFYAARDAGVLVVAAAGNDNVDVAENQVWPCILGPVLCIGALADGTNTPIWYSNQGGLLWAPTNILTMGDDAVAGLAVHGGTSASAPFASGVAAMMKAMDPTLAPGDLVSLLLSTAWKDSPDPAVKAYVNAYRAVSAAGENRLPADRFEANETAATAKPLGPGSYPGLTIGTSADVDQYRITVPDYSTLDIDLDFSGGLGSPLLDETLVSEGGGGTDDVTDTKSPNSRRYHAGTVGPGTYVLKLWSPTPTIYDLKVTLKGIDLAPDKFEPNNTFATAANPEPGFHTVNLHTAGDIDFYHYTVPKSAVANFPFEVAADWPVTVRLLDAGGVEVARNDGSTAAMDIPSGSYTVEVSGSRRGRYTIRAQQEAEARLLPEFIPAAKDGPDAIDPKHPPGPHALMPVSIHRTLSFSGGTLVLGIPRGCVSLGDTFRVTLKFKRLRRTSNAFVKVTRADFSIANSVVKIDRRAPFAKTLTVAPTRAGGSTFAVKARAHFKVKDGRRPAKSIKASVKTCSA